MNERDKPNPDSNPGGFPPPGTPEAEYLAALHAMLWDPTPFTDEELDDLTKNGVDFGEAIPEVAACLEARRVARGA